MTFVLLTNLANYKNIGRKHQKYLQIKYASETVLKFKSSRL